MRNGRHVLSKIYLIIVKDRCIILLIFSATIDLCNTINYLLQRKGCFFFPVQDSLESITQEKRHTLGFREC